MKKISLSMSIALGIFILSLFLSVGYSAFKEEVSINEAHAFVSPQMNIKITKININDFVGNALSVGEAFNVDNISASIDLPKSTSKVIYDVKITNFGNIEYGLYGINNLPSNLKYEIEGLKEKEEVICENDRCINGVSKVITLSIMYKDGGFTESKTKYNIIANFDFRVFHNITYADEVKEAIEDKYYPSRIMEGCNLKLNIKGINVDVYGNSLKLEKDKDYTFSESVLSINNVSFDLFIEGAKIKKAYLLTNGKNTYYKETTYKDKIENVEFVHYINTDHAVKEYDLSTTKDESIIGWLELNENDMYDLYIGSNSDMYLLNDSGKEMFAGLKNLKSIEFNNLIDTSEATDMSYMFYNVPNLETLDVSKFDTKNVVNMDAMFNVVGNVNREKNDPTAAGNDGYDYMGKLILSGVENFNTSKLENMEWLFSGIANSNLDVSNFNVSKVKSLKRVFSNCWNLESIDLTNWSTPNNTSLYNTFAHMHKIKEIDISSFDTKNVTTLRGLFNDNMVLENIIMPEVMDTSQVTVMQTVFANCPKLEHVNITNWDTRNVTTMAEMFSNAAALLEVDVSSFDTRNVTTMANMFAGTSSLKTIDVSNFNTSKVTTMANMFGYVKYAFGGDLVASTPTSLETLDVSGFDTKNVTTMEGMFKGCTSLTELNVSHFNTSKVTNMSNMFAGLTSVTSLDVSNFDTRNVTTMSYMFGRYTETKGTKPVYYLDSITLLDVSNFVTPKLTNITYMFSGLRSVLNLDIRNFDTSLVTSMEGLFQNTISIKELDISYLNTPKVTSFKNMFSTSSSTDYMSLEKIIGLDKLTFDNITTIEGMFQRCSNIKELELKDIDAPKLTSVGYLFSGMTSLERLTFTNLNATSLKSMFTFGECPNIKYVDISGLNGPLIASSLGSIFTNKLYLEEVNMENVYLPKVTNLSSMFAKDPLLTNVNLNGADFSSVTNISSMFSGCTAIEVIDMSEIKTSSVTTMNNMFYGATSLKSVNLSGMDTKNVTNMSNMFYNCSSLTNLSLDGIDTSNVTLMNGMFQGAISLKVLDLSSFNTAKVTNMSNMFYSGNSSTYMSLEEIRGIENFEPLSVTNMTNMFAYNKSLTSLDLSKWNTPKLTTMTSMFQSSYSLESIDISNFDTSNVTNMSGLFYGGTYNMALKEIKGLENLNFEKATTIANMFNRCVELEEITLNLNGLALTTFQNIFYNDANLKRVILKDMNLPVYSNASTFASLLNLVQNIEEVDLSGLNAPLITSFGTMFSTKKSLRKVDLSNSNLPSLNTFSSLFINDSALKNVNFDGMVTGKITNFSNAFKGCLEVEELDLSMIDTKYATTMASMFSTSSDTVGMSLKRIVGIDKFDFSSVTNMSEMLKGCRDLVGEMTIDLATKPSISNTFNRTSMNDGASFTVKYTDNTEPWANDLIKAATFTTNVNFEKI